MQRKKNIIHHLIFVESLLSMSYLPIPNVNSIFFSMNFSDVTKEAARRAQNLADQAYTSTKTGNVKSTRVKCKRIHIRGSSSPIEDQ